jgi:hypothetical protein
MPKFTDLLNVVKSSEIDAQDFFGKGNKAAGTRLRAKMQAIKILASEIRKEVSEIKNA